MKKVFFTAMLVCIMFSSAWGAVEINSTNFPDDNFRYSINYFDSQLGNGNGWLDDEEIANLTGMEARERGIKSFKGIEYLTELKDLDCRRNELTEIDLSKNTKLERFWCSENKIEVLDFTSNPEITEIVCSRNDLKSLDVTGCTKLEWLNCRLNGLLEVVDVSTCVSLVSLDCQHCQYLSSVNVKGCRNLVTLWCEGEGDITFSKLTELDVTDCPKLSFLACNNNMISELDLSHNPELVTLYCGNNNLSELDVTANRKLQVLHASSNRISHLNLSNNTELLHLGCTWNLLDTLDVSRNTKLETLTCSDNNLRELNLSNNRSIWLLECADNHLATLNLSGLPLSSDYTSALGRQIISHLVTEHQSESNPSYPYHLDFTRYMTQLQTGNIIASSVKAYDDDDNEIAVRYSAGTAELAGLPSVVKYSYATGFGTVSIDAAITDDNYLTLSLNNHVYRVFNNGLLWDNAKEYCESLGGHLVTISGDAEFDLVAELCRRAKERIGYFRELFWVGAELQGYQRTEDRWKWVTDEPFTAKVSEDLSNVYSVMNVLRDNFLRHLAMDYRGYLCAGRDTRSLGFICEWEPVSTDFAPYSEEYREYIADPEAYFDGLAFLGEIPSPFDWSHLKDNPPVVSSAESSAFRASASRSKYDPREHGINLPVRNQGGYGTCWTFAALGSLEASYIVQGYGQNAPDLSELHMAWFAYNDEREGYALPLLSRNKQILSQGGTNETAVALLSRAGVASESDIPYPDRAGMSDAEVKARVTSKFPGRLPEEYDHPLMLKEVFVLGDMVDESNTENIKDFIYRIGAVKISMAWPENIADAMQGSAFYLPTNISSGHAVMLVGWDDEYSASNFKNNPGRKGAWLAKNSHGTNFGDGGFFWISYAQPLSNPAVFTAADSKVSKLYGHDTIDADDAIPYHWSACIFRADDDEKFSEVSFRTNDNNTEYEVYINRFGAETEPSKPGTPKEVLASGTKANAGYHTVALNSPVEVKEGEYFSVIVKFSGSSPYKYYSAVEDTGKVRSSSTVTVAGKSYFAMNETTPVSADWKDGKQLYEEGKVRDASCGACVKIFSISGGSTPNTPNNPDNPVNIPDNPNNPNEPGTSGSSGGGGGCDASSLPAILGALALTLTLRRKR